MINKIVSRLKEINDEKMGIYDHIIEIIRELLKDIIPDLNIGIGWEENPDCISIRNIFGRYEEGMVSLDSLLNSLFNHEIIEIPFGIYLTKSQADDIKQRFNEMVI